MIALVLVTVFGAAASQPAGAPAAGRAALQVRIIHGNNKGSGLDPKIKDLAGPLKNFAFKAYDLKNAADLTLTVDGPTVTHPLPPNRKLNVAAKDYKKQKGKGQVQIELEIPELKFKGKATVMEGATLVIGGPKFEDGVLFFALTATALTP